MEDIKKELQLMVEEDQTARNEPKIDWEKTSKIDRKNTARMKELVTEYGWLTIGLVGEEAAHQAWLLVQHADHDLEFQQYCLRLMTELPNTEVAGKDIAFLTDRVGMKLKGLQKYGTQYFVYPDYILVMPLEDNSNLDELRRSVGIKSIKEQFKDQDKPVYLVERKLLVEK